MRKRIKTLLLLMAFIATVSPCYGQGTQPAAAELPIQDNSFLIEEAYNQEDGVVQHVNTFSRSWQTKGWLYTFTQEWPVTGQKHQLSFTLPVQRVGDAASGRSSGVGDLAINYRYQLIGSGDAKLAVSPRVSLLLATGDEGRGLGAGAAGVQFNLPVSVAHSRRVVTHWNAGTTFVPSAKSASGERADTTGHNLGQSTVWLARQNFNVMIEAAWNRAESVVGTGLTEREYSMYLNPGVRWAHNLPGGLQIVPGVSAPIGVGPSRGDRGLFFYLSFEHPFK